MNASKGMVAKCLMMAVLKLFFWPLVSMRYSSEVKVGDLQV